jgi:hypothetical protein
MDIYELQDVSECASRYKIPFAYEQIKQEDYKVSFGKVTFKNSKACMKFLDAVIQEHGLEDFKPYRVCFGWEIY